MTDINRRDALRLIGAAAISYAAPPLAAARASVITRPIPSSGEQLPIIGLGTWQTFDVGSSSTARAQLEDVLRAFVELGGRVVDSSPMYGTSEEVVGDLAAKLGLHSKLFLATKVWTMGKKAGIEQMEESFRKLRAKRMDLMQVHNLEDVAVHMPTLLEWKRAGRIRYVGVTHWTASSHDSVISAMKKWSLDFVQINYSVAEREAERRLLPLAKESGVAVIANRPFVSGELLRRLSGKPLPGWAKEIGAESWAQLLLKFAVSHPAITCAIPATSKVTHMRDNMRAALGPLPDEKLRRRIADLV